MIILNADMNQVINTMRGDQPTSFRIDTDYESFKAPKKTRPAICGLPENAWVKAW